jgi:hypothetical protein
MNVYVVIEPPQGYSNLLLFGLLERSSLEGDRIGHVVVLLPA